jgi:hypothetical protein
VQSAGRLERWSYCQQVMMLFTVKVKDALHHADIHCACCKAKQKAKQATMQAIMTDRMWTDKRVDCFINCLEDEKCLYAVTCRDCDCDVHPRTYTHTHTHAHTHLHTHTHAHTHLHAGRSRCFAVKDVWKFFCIELASILRGQLTPTLQTMG